MNGKEVRQMPSFASDPEAASISYLKLGFHVEQNVWTPSQCDTLIRASENLASFRDGTFAPAMNPHRVDPAMLSALRNPTIVRIMEWLVSGRVWGLQSEFFFCPPGTPGFAKHQDNYYVQAKREVFASAWSAMQDVTPEMGGLVVYPGSHNEPILSVEALPHEPHVSQDRNANRQQVVLPKGYEPVPLSVAMGSVVFLHGHIVHASTKNCTDRFRRALVTTYIRSGERFRPGLNAGRVAVEVY